MEDSILFCGMMMVSIIAGGLLGYAIGTQERENKETIEEHTQTNIKKHNPVYGNPIKERIEPLATVEMPDTLVPQTPPVLLHDPLLRKYQSGHQFRAAQPGRITEAINLSEMIQIEQ